MSKGIIVVDIPSDCRGCQLRDLADYCITGKNVVEYRYRNSKPSWCPIKPLSDRISEYDNTKTYTDKDGNIRIGVDINLVNHGRNACLDEIAGKV